MMSCLALVVVMLIVTNEPAVDGPIVRLPPSAFRSVPAPVRRALEEAGCTIPQTYGDATPHNIISGSFVRRDRKDWAVLCSRRATSSILVMRADGSLIAELASRPDEEYMQGIGGDRYGFSRLLDVASPSIIRRYFSYRNKPSPPLSHDGIDDIFDGKASTVHYYARGRWLRLPGSD